VSTTGLLFELIYFSTDKHTWQVTHNDSIASTTTNSCLSTNVSYQ